MSPVEVQDRTENVRVLEGVQYGVSDDDQALRALQQLRNELCFRMRADESSSIALTWNLDSGFANELGRGKLTWCVTITTSQHRLERWEP